MSGAGPESEMYEEGVEQANLSVYSSDYFPRRPDHYGNRSTFGLDPQQGTLHRHQYQYNVDYPIRTRKGESKWGHIELRGIVHTYHSGGEFPERLREQVENAAHRAAYCFDSSVETSSYAGYLTGFNAENPTHPGNRWEHEPRPDLDARVTPGKIEWSVEVYDTNRSLSGQAAGVADPWTETSKYHPPEDAVDVTPHKWELTWNASREMYDVHARGGTRSRKRYASGAGAGKRVYINGKAVGKLDEEGRTWLTPEYARGDGHTTSGPFGTYWSREGLVSETEATYQALRKGGTLYVTGETEYAVYLATARAKPDGYEAHDGDGVSPSIEAREGREGFTAYYLALQEPETALRIECRQDQEVIRHLGLSMPTWEHSISTGWSA